MATGTGAKPQFAISLYQCINKGRETKNVIISPFAVHLALGMAFMGAAGETKDEMASVLNISKVKAEATKLFARTIHKYQRSSTLSVANKIYLPLNKAVHPYFIQLSEKSFNSSTENIDFSLSTRAASIINDWVEGQTNGRIRNLIDPGRVSARTAMILVNAVYFKGLWKIPFDKKMTRKAEFWIDEMKTVQVDMMTLDRGLIPFSAVEHLDATAVELKFNEGDMSMLIILPDRKMGLSDLETKLDLIHLSTLRKNMRSEKVIVRLPKFTTEFNICLNDILQRMGLVLPFSKNADFSELLDIPSPLNISEVFHKAYIDVTEEGVEAGASAAAMITLSAFPQRPREFIVDHPFILMIVDEDQILFIGKKVDF